MDTQNFIIVAEKAFKCFTCGWHMSKEESEQAYAIFKAELEFALQDNGPTESEMAAARAECGDD